MGVASDYLCHCFKYLKTDAMYAISINDKHAQGVVVKLEALPEECLGNHNINIQGQKSTWHVELVYSRTFPGWCALSRDRAMKRKASLTLYAGRPYMLADPICWLTLYAG